MKRRIVPSPAAKRMALVATISLLGGCGNLQSLPTPPGHPSQAPSIPGPFTEYDPARPPQFKRAPDPVAQPSPPPEGGKTESPSFGGVLRPVPAEPSPGTQKDKKKEKEDEGWGWDEDWD